MPVIARPVGGVPEVAGDAALLLDDDDGESVVAELLALAVERRASCARRCASAAPRASPPTRPSRRRATLRARARVARALTPIADRGVRPALQTRTPSCRYAASSAAAAAIGQRSPRRSRRRARPRAAERIARGVERQQLAARRRRRAPTATASASMPIAKSDSVERGRAAARRSTPLPACMTVPANVSACTFAPVTGKPTPCAVGVALPVGVAASRRARSSRR